MFVLARSFLEVHLGAEPIARGHRDTQQRTAVTGQEFFDALGLGVPKLLEAVGFILRRFVLMSLFLILGVLLLIGFLLRCEVLLFGKIVRHRRRLAAGGNRRWSTGRIIRCVFRLQWRRGGWRLRFRWWFRVGGSARFGLFPNLIGVADGLLYLFHPFRR